MWQYDINGAFQLPGSVVEEYLKQKEATDAPVEEADQAEEQDKSEDSENIEN